MRYNKGRLVYLETNHKGCWVELTELFDSEIKVLDIIFNSSLYFRIRSLIINNSGNIFKFISKLRKHPYIGNIKQIFVKDNSYGVYDIYIKKHNSTPEVISEFNGTILDHYIKDGFEVWKLIIPSHIDKFKERVNELFNIRKYVEQPLNNIINYFYTPELSNRELDSLYLAYIYGYYEYPKKIKAKHLAKLLNLNEATFLYHLRKAEKKIISSYIFRSIMLRHLNINIV